MAAVVTAFEGTRVSQAENATDGGTWDDWDSGKTPANEPDFVYQFGSPGQSISAKVGTSEAGIELEAWTSAVDFSTTPKVLMFKVIATNYAKLNTIGPTAMVLYIGSGTTTDRYNYYVHGSDTYPIAGGWVFVPIDPNVTAYRDATDGTPSLTAVDYCAISCTFTATSKSENVAMDAVDYYDSGTGLKLTRGDSTDADGVFQDFVDLDEGTSSNRWAVVRTVEGIIYVLGTLTIGESATATEFTDSNRTLVFPETLTDVGFSGIKVDVQNASTVVNWTDCTFVGRGRTNLKRWFDTENEVDGTNEEIDFVAHGFKTGEAVLYSKQGGTEAIGLTDATEYWVESVTADTFSLHTTRQNAMTAATPVGLTASTAGNGEQHSLRRQPDNRPTLTVTGTTASSFNPNGCIFDSFRLLTLTSAATMTGCKFVNCSALTAAQGKLTNCTITTPLLTEGEEFITTPDLSDISGCSFSIGDDGHAIEITATGTYGFSANTFSGYWAHSGTPGDGAEFTTDSGGVDGVGEDITTNAAHGLTTGDAVYYNDGGGVATIGLTDGNRYYVNVISTTNVSLHETKQDATSDTNRVPLNTSGAETHALYSTKAAIVNNSGGLVTINVTNGGDTPTVRNVGASTTVVNNAVNLTITVKDEAGVGILNAQTAIYDTSGTQLMNEDTLASGVATESFNYTTDTDIIVRVRKSSTGATKYESFSTTGTITANGFTLLVTLIEDTKVDL